MDDWTIVTQTSANDDVMKRGRMKSILHQCSKNAWDFQQPCTATTSGGTPLRRSSVAPPILKQWPVSCKRPASFQIWLHHVRNHGRVMGAHPPLAVSKAKRGAWGGTMVLAEIWWLSVETGLEMSSTRDKIILALVLSVVFDQGIGNDDQDTPLAGDLWVILMDRAMWRDSLKELTQLTMSSPSLVISVNK